MKAQMRSLQRIADFVHTSGAGAGGLQLELAAPRLNTARLESPDEPPTELAVLAASGAYGLA
jgi:hypothetical protein